MVLLSATLFLCGVIAFIGTYENNRLINSVNQNFDYTEDTAGVVSLKVTEGNTMTLRFGKDSVKVIDSGKTVSRKTCIIVISFIRYYANEHTITITQSNIELIGEYRLHTYLYRIGYRTKQTKDADIEYNGDPRWYVRAASKTFGWFGI